MPATTLALLLADLADKRRLYGEIEADYYATKDKDDKRLADSQLSVLASDIDALERRGRTLIAELTGVPFDALIAANL